MFGRFKAGDGGRRGNGGRGSIKLGFTEFTPVWFDMVRIGVVGSLGFGSV